MFSLPYIIAYISILFWIFPAIRNYKTDLFFYFLVWAIADPIVLATSVLSPIYGLRLFLLFAVFTFLSLKIMVKNKSFYNIFLIFILALNLWTAFISKNILYLTLAFEHIIIAFIFAARLLAYVAFNSKVKVFHIILFLYEVSLVMKLILFVFDVKTGLSYYMLTNIFEMTIAIFFSIYKETDNKLTIDLRNV